MDPKLIIDSEKVCRYSFGSVGVEKKGSIRFEDNSKVLMASMIGSGTTNQNSKSEAIEFAYRFARARWWKLFTAVINKMRQ